MNLILTVKHLLKCNSLLRGAVTAVALSQIACAASIGQSDPPSATTGLQDGKNALFKLDLEAARGAFEKAMNSDQVSASDRAEAARRLANIAWRFDQDWSRAEQLLQRAMSLAPQSFKNSFERSRLLESRGHFDEALASAREALTREATRDERTRALTAIGRLLLVKAEAVSDLEDSQRRELTAALAALLPTVVDNPGRLDPARTALELALMVDDADAALKAWRSYFQAPAPSSGDAGGDDSWLYSMMAGAHDILTRRLSNWKGALSVASDRIAVVQALTDSKFFAAAARLAADTRIAPASRIDKRPDVSDLIAYRRYLKAVGGRIEDLYRRRALGQTSRFDEELRRENRRLWQGLHFPGDRPAFNDSVFWKEISERFGVQVYFRSDRGGRAVHIGHRVIDERRKVTQYGRSTTFRFAVLDAMVTNGYTSWFWDGAGATGGWVDNDGIVIQVRASYAAGPLRAWDLLTDPKARSENDGDIQEKTAQDEIAAAADPHAYLPGLALRIRRRAYQKVLKRFQNGGLEGGDLKLAFVAEIGRRAFEASIVAHEGRHALERLNVPANWARSGADKEFLAKLSEVALAPDPWIGIIGGILSPNIGDGSSHGQANLRIVKGLVRWMKAHESEIQRLDRSRPHLPQLDLLTDVQLREAIQSLDPWVR